MEKHEIIHKAEEEKKQQNDKWWEKEKEKCSERKFPVTGKLSLICKSSLPILSAFIVVSCSFSSHPHSEFKYDTPK